MKDNTSASTTKANTVKRSASPFGTPNDTYPTFDLRSEMPETFRQMTEQGVAQAKETYDKAKAVTEEVTDLLSDAYASATKGVADYNLKVMENVRINSTTAFDYALQLLEVKSPADFAELSTAYARKHLEAMTAQTKALAELAQKLTTEMTEPLKAGATKAFNNKLA